MAKKKMLIFHPALAPYRVDQFNTLSQLFDLEVVFIFDNVWNHRFDQSKLLSQLTFRYSFLLIGPNYKGRVFRFGMYRTIKRTRPEIIIGYEYSFTTQYLILLKVCGIIDQKIGTITDDSIEICNHIQSRIRHLARKLFTKRLDFLVVLSSEVSNFYKEKFNFNNQEIIVSPILQQSKKLRNNSEQLERIAIEYAKKHKLSRKKVILFVGRFIHEKALPRFLFTVKNLLKEREDLVLIFVGDGEERQKIEGILRDNQLDGKLLLPGRFEGQELYAWYLSASGFVLPSTSEPFGAVVNEALIFGLKVFCSKYAGATSLIDSENGLIFDPLNENETVEKLKCFINSIDILEEISLAKKTSLMHNFQDNLLNEWRKLIND